MKTGSEEAYLYLRSEISPVFHSREKYRPHIVAVQKFPAKLECQYGDGP